MCTDQLVGPLGAARLVWAIERNDRYSVCDNSRTSVYRNAFL